MICDWKVNTDLEKGIYDSMNEGIKLDQIRRLC